MKGKKISTGSVYTVTAAALAVLQMQGSAVMYSQLILLQAEISPEKKKISFLILSPIHIDQLFLVPPVIRFKFSCDIVQHVECSLHVI